MCSASFNSGEWSTDDSSFFAYDCGRVAHDSLAFWSDRSSAARTLGNGWFPCSRKVKVDWYHLDTQNRYHILRATLRILKRRNNVGANTVCFFCGALSARNMNHSISRAKIWFRMLLSARMKHLFCGSLKGRLRDWYTKSKIKKRNKVLRPKNVLTAQSQLF